MDNKIPQITDILQLYSELLFNYVNTVTVLFENSNELKFCL